MIGLLDDDADRWRPHIKTVKLGAMMQLLTGCGVMNFKCATSLELLAACQAGSRDVLVAYAHAGANAQRVAEIGWQYPHVRVSGLVENQAQIAAWKDTPVSLFIDVNPGMNRTGIDHMHLEEITQLASAIRESGVEFRGLHYYDGHISDDDLQLRTERAHAGYERLLKICGALTNAGLQPGEVITAGTPAFPCALSFTQFRDPAFRHRVSPGTIVYNDTTSLKQLPGSFGFEPAVFVLSRVISRPAPNRITCDAGHKAVGVDAGVPNCVVQDWPELKPLKPSEEHLPMELPEGGAAPEIGSYLQLLPKHVCPTVNNFDSALLVENGKIASVEAVSARGHEGPLRPPQ